MGALGTDGLMFQVTSYFMFLDGTWGRVLTGEGAEAWVKRTRFNAFYRKVNPINLKIFPNHGRINKFERNVSSILERGLRYPQKREDNRERWNRELRHSGTLVFEMQESFMQSLSALLFWFFGNKKED